MNLYETYIIMPFQHIVVQYFKDCKRMFTFKGVVHCVRTVRHIYLYPKRTLITDIEASGIAYN